MRTLQGVFLIALATTGCVSHPEQVLVEKGKLDLHNVNPREHPVIKLNGSWAFYWNTFASQKKPDSAFREYIRVPASWYAYTSKSHSKTHFGYATYQATILLPDSGRQWSLYLPPVHSAYKIFVNGKLIGQAGTPSQDKSMIPEVRPQVLSFYASSSTADILLEVSNFHFNTGGILSPLYLGTPPQISALYSRSAMISAFLIGSLLIMGLYHFGLFALWKRDRSALYFGVICIFIALRESYNGIAPFYLLFPHAGYEFSIKILYAVFPVCLIAFNLFLRSLFPQLSRWLEWTAWSIGCAFLVLILFTKNSFYAPYLIFVSAAFFVQCLCWLWIIICGLRANHRENVLVLAGLTALIVCFFNDVLFEAEAIESAFLLPLGFFVFILCQSLLLAIRFSNAFRRTETLSLQLTRTNQLKEVEELKNRFFANITHEFRTPLTLIISPVESMLRDCRDSLSATRLHVIRKNAGQLLQLINQLLDLSKLEAGRMSINSSSGDIKAFFANIVDSFRIMATEKSIALSLRAELPPQLYFEAEKFEKIATNLISNAIKFTAADGTVSVEVTMASKSEVCLRVCDTGIGIPSDQLPNIFTRFYQVDSSPLRKYPGTGIGLALVKELVDLLRGTIEVDSQMGSGTIFTVRLPVSHVADGNEVELPTTLQAHEALTTTETSIPVDTDPLILVVEDNEELQNYIANDLLRNYQVTMASNGREGWDICQRQMPDIVVSDVMMPEMDGFDLCKMIKSTPVTDHIAVILLTAKTAAESRIAGLSFGANDYVPKPFHAQELALRIKNLLNYQRTLRQHYQALLHPGNQAPIPDNPFLNKFFTVIESQLENSGLSIGEVSSAMAMSSRTLNRKLGALVGLSCSEVIRNYRLKKAAELLVGGHNVSETAYLVGFESPSYFGLCFKEHFHLTPSEYIRRIH